MKKHVKWETDNTEGSIKCGRCWGGRTKLWRVIEAGSGNGNKFNGMVAVGVI